MVSNKLQPFEYLERKCGPNFRILLLVFGFFLLLQKSTYAGNDTSFFAKGRVIDTVLCLQHPGFSYALFLPIYFTKTKKWPVIYIFDPAARGSLAVNNFMQAAEIYGYILVCSNNSRNGVWDKEIEASNNTSEDVENRLPIDFNRIYTSGFSGGSRLAAFIACNTKRISGVIGCGAGFPSANVSMSTEPTPFVYVGIVGNKDMNYLEMFEFEEKLNNLGVMMNLLTFNSGHEWPPSQLLQDAIEWLELEAMKKGFKQKNDSFIHAQFEKLVEKVRLLYNQGDLIETARFYKYMIRDFSDQPEILNYQKELDSLKQTKVYKKAVKEWGNIKIKELDYRKVLLMSLHDIFTTRSLPDSVRYWWIREIRNLRKMEEGHDQNEQLMASRLINMLAIMCYESGMSYMNTNQYDLAAMIYELGTIVQPQNMYAFYRLARAYALNNDSKKSLNALDKSIEIGLKNKQMLENDSAFNSLKDEKRYKALIGKLQD